MGAGKLQRCDKRHQVDCGSNDAPSYGVLMVSAKHQREDKMLSWMGTMNSASAMGIQIS